MKQLFKYLSKPRNLFEDGFIRLSQPSVLNDPFEANFCSKSLDELTNHFDDPNAFDMDFGETSFSQYIKNRMHDIGIISFSENKENLLMWAHYADEHRGVVAGVSYWSEHKYLHLFHDLFTDVNQTASFGPDSDYFPFHGIPKPVIYRKGLRYRHDKFDYDYSNISVEGADRFLYEVFLQKSDEWIYEQEHRVILKLEQADRVILPNINEITNTAIKDRILKADYAFEDPKTKIYTINLFEIKEDGIRGVISYYLAKLSQNPKVIYLMKLSSSAINNCLIGINSNTTKAEILGSYACSTGYLNVWKAQKNNDYYSLEFEEV